MSAHQWPEGQVLTGYFDSVQDARRTFTTLNCEFEAAAMQPHETPGGAGPPWSVWVVVPVHGPYLHGAEATAEFEDVITRCNGTMDAQPVVKVVACRR